MAGSETTPMLQQYQRIKREIPPDALLLFRVGDFYEMFFDDAKNGAQLLNLALTARSGIPLCGIPHHAAESYIARLLKQGRKVAICDQMEEARPGKLVQREVTQIVSPGAHFDGRILHAGQNNFLGAIMNKGGRFGFALVDLTTGDFRVTELETAEQLQTEFERLSPSEIIVQAEQKEAISSVFPLSASRFSSHDDWTFEYDTAYFTLRDHFKTQSLDGFGCNGLTLGIGAAGAILHYLQNGLRRNIQHINRLNVYSAADYLVLDSVSQRNLELIESARGDRQFTLIGVLGETVTPMGARLLRDWITRPLNKVEPIVARQDAVAEFIEQNHVLTGFREQSKAVKDLERTIGRLSVDAGNARDLIVLKQSLAALPALKATLQPLLRATTLTESGPSATVALQPETLQALRAKHGDPLESYWQREFGHGLDCLTESEARHLLKAPHVDEIRNRITAALQAGSGPAGGGIDRVRETPQIAAPVRLLDLLASELHDLPDLVALISRAIVDEPPLALKEGGIIREGFDKALDELRGGSKEGKDWVAALP